MGQAIYTETERADLERKYRPHPAAEHFPMMDGARFDELVASIRRDGQLDPIVLLDGMVLDGRNRLRACAAIGMQPRFEEADPNINPFDFVESKNIDRRDLEAMQREAIRFRLRKASDEFEKEARRREANLKRSEAAMRRPRENNKFGASAGPDGPSLERNHAKQRHATGTQKRVAELAKASPALLEKVALGEVKGMQALREVKRAELGEKIRALPAGKFRVIYADPPWKYGDERGGLEVAGSAAESQYPTMPTDKICEFTDETGRHASDLAAPDAVLFMWATFPLLEDAMRVIPAWGFKYKTAIVWHKQRSNVGNYHDASCELLMIATRGSCPIEINERVCQMQSIARGRHSAKPEDFRALIDRLYPSGPRVELFRRGEAPEGWTIWGNEAE